ncbi:hypothetical protein [Bacillus subtilis]|uniref:hypothetical protein n=1 Tax=Bacillus subtilis TaxID=1423 RepID=UPI000A881F42|nr:hypothetical protein [Bacillus subtilis]MCM3013755.1 hypothetical protein [Bacillus subtilis]MCM3523580.1 hypothetical protein [Bacillus subtilis]MDX7996918.1 hypothetical protein [Bacillus subtilis]
MTTFAFALLDVSAIIDLLSILLAIFEWFIRAFTSIIYYQSSTAHHLNMLLAYSIDYYPIEIV